MATRRFLIVGHTQTTDPDLSLNDLSGMGGRLDVLCRAVTSALCTSHGVRNDTEVWCVIDHDEVEDTGPRTVRFDGATIKSLNPDERTTAALFKRAFATDVVDNGHFDEAHPGVTVGLMGLKKALKLFAEDGPVVLMEKDGEDIRETKQGLLRPEEGPPGFVLSDHKPFTDGEVALLHDVATGSLSVAGDWLQGHSVITLVHDEVDRRAPPDFDGEA